MKPRIIYVPWGLGITINRNGKKWIEINKNLKKYPKLHKQILEHESKHFYGKEYSFSLDIKTMTRWDSELIKFVVVHPMSWWVISPFYPTTKGIIIASPNWQIWSIAVLLFIITVMIILFF